MSRAYVPAVVVVGLFAACATADVVILSRFSQLSAHNQTPGFPNPHSDVVSTSDIAAGTLTTPHGSTFVSSVSPQAIHAELFGFFEYGGTHSLNVGQSTTLDVHFEVTGSPVSFSLQIFSGSSFAYAYPSSNINLTLTNTGTNQAVYDLRTSTPPTVMGIPPGAEWSPQTWQTTLQPGGYRLYGVTSTLLLGGGGGGSPNYGGGGLNFTATMTPVPGAAAALGLGLAAALRRRR